MEPSDLELLRGYVCDGEESAFSRLVERHAPWLKGAARRRLRDGALADDATQVAFMLLASKAASLARSRRRSLAGWLFHAMHFTCVRIRRTHAREARHEAEMGTLYTSGRRSDPADVQLLTLLEDSIAQLPPLDQEAVTQRFYRGADWAAVGRALGTTPGAARKRVRRALMTLRKLMMQDGIDVVPSELLGPLGEEVGQVAEVALSSKDRHIRSIAKGADAMMQQAQAGDFTAVSAEFFVRDVEENLEFFEKLGFRRRWTESPDAMGRIPRASLAGGAGRVWLRRASEAEGTRPAPGVGVFFWMNGADALAAHRDRITAKGIDAGPFFDDHTLRNFTVRTPDGYTIGFYTAYRTTAEAKLAGDQRLTLSGSGT